MIRLAHPSQPFSEISMNRFLFALSLFVFVSLHLQAAPDPESKPAAKKRILFITDSGGFIHDSVGLSEKVLKELGVKNGFEVDCFRFTRDPNQTIKVKQKKPDGTTDEITTTVLAEYAERFRKTTGVTVEKENCGRVTAELLKKYDCVFFFTTGNPLTPDEVKALVAWVKAGGAYAGTHCASDTLYQAPEYGELVGGYFVNHPWHQDIVVKTEDPNHPAGKAFLKDNKIKDEIYQFREPYSREKLRIILSVENTSIDTKKEGVKRTDGDFAISWCQDFGKGRSFYTSLGHRKEVWTDPRFQEHLINGLQWAMKLKEGTASPSK
jgi:uncharacterized protein